MKLKALSRQIETAMRRNSTSILTGLGVASLATTAYLTARASFKASELLLDAKERNDLREISLPMTKRDKFALVWQLYLPASGVGILGAACIISANRVGSKRTAAMAAAYTMSQEAFSDYRDQVVEKIGERKEAQVREAVSAENVRKNAPDGTIVIAQGKVLFRDSVSGRYFESEIETVRRAENDFNQMLLHDSYGSLSEWYSRIGLSNTAFSDHIGFNTDNMLGLHQNAVMSEDGRPCIELGYHDLPVADYNKRR